ncbi:MAG TPA: helix-turn-helix transcriptional regulator [Steroidobacteraceae bacterium]|jgi:transcriptional regulator with XRE-family HTH domain|nr:helix-turn-helix transcriptional regulator [Steroidobacteraceae bacterium]
MKGKLKQFRVDAGMTQRQAAQKVGVSQPNYQRWESGSAPIPADKVKKLAKALKTSPAAILGRYLPVQTAPSDRPEGADLSYHGEISIHFCGGGEPLVLSISEGAFHRLYDQLQRRPAFVTVASLANQTVAIRTRAIAELHLYSQAYDVSRDHPDHIGIQIPDPRDWAIVEALAAGDVGEFDPFDVDRVTNRIMVTDEQYRKRVADGKIKPEDLEGMRKKDRKETDRIFDLATGTKYQLSSGQQRRLYVDAPETLFDALYELTDSGGGDPDNIIVLPAQGAHRTVFINKDALDYVICPTHLYLQGRTDADSRDLDSVEHADR